MQTNTVERTIDEAQAAMTVKRAFGEPFKVGELTILPVARVGGGGGGGGGNGRSAGWGTGFTLMSRPMGVFVIDATDAHWLPISSPNPIVGMLTAPVNALRTLLVGPGPLEKRLGQIFATPAPSKVASPIKSHRPRGRNRHVTA